MFKTTIQFPAENSIISTIAFMSVAVSAHYEIGWGVSSKLEREMYNKESEIPKGVRLLYNIVSAARKHLPLNPVLSAM